MHPRDCALLALYCHTSEGVVFSRCQQSPEENIGGRGIAGEPVSYPTGRY